MTFKKSYVPGILGSVLTLTVIMAAPVKAETKEETILNKTDWSTRLEHNGCSKRRRICQHPQRGKRRFRDRRSSDAGLRSCGNGERKRVE